MSLYTTMGIQQIEMLIGHLRKQDKTGKFLTVALGCLQQEVGTRTSVLKLQYNLFHMFSTKSWLRQLWYFLHKIGGHIRIKNEWIPNKTFENDINISNEVSKMRISNEAKYEINICRLFKRCYFIGDILQPDGKKLIPGAMSLAHRGFHKDKFPKVQVPKKFEELWQFAIRTIMQQNALGNALGNIISVRAQEWVLDKSENFLIHQRYTGSHTIHIKIAESSYSKNPSSLIIPISPAYVAHVLSGSTHFKVRSKQRVTEVRKTSSPLLPNRRQLQTFKQYIHSFPKVYRRNIGLLKGCSYSQQLANYLEKGELIAVGDASVDKKQGAHSFILETTDEKWRLTGKAPVDADPDDMTSNRAEGCSVIAMITLLTALYKYHDLKRGKVEVFCDNAEALRRRYSPKLTYTKLVQRDMDIKMEVEGLLNLTDMRVSFHHVKSHADDDEEFDYDMAPQPTKRNIDMDTIAKEFLTSPPPHLRPNNHPLMFPSQKAALYLNDRLWAPLI